MNKGICGLYCFKNKDGDIIYIGKADDIHARLKNHKHLCSECYEELHTIEYAIVNNKADRDILELLLISKLQPKYNQQLKYTDKPTLVITDNHNYRVRTLDIMYERILCKIIFVGHVMAEATNNFALRNQ